MQKLKNIIVKMVESWSNNTGNINAIEDIINWVDFLNKNICVNVNKISLDDSEFWYYDKLEGGIVNTNRSFFSIKGIIKKVNDEILLEQPIIIQNEIGYLGILCKEFDGVLNFLMQAKIEPGNLNKIQISPTIQATKSNFTQKHGGNKPKYLDYFIKSSNHEIIVDQIQSEQSSRFYKKRNRNIIIKVDEDIDVLPNYKWMTLGQIKKLMKVDNLVNMDTRTVLSCIPFSNIKLDEIQLENIYKLFRDKSLFHSIFYGVNENLFPKVYHQINNYKMFDNSEIEIVSLEKLNLWKMKEKEFISKEPYNFKVIFCDISIEGREVSQWTQPLFEADGVAIFGLLMCNDEGIKKFLVNLNSEVGCFDSIELGPSVQIESIDKDKIYNEVTSLFFNYLDCGKNIIFDNLLSEEGGRFYHEQNRNVIIEVEKSDLVNVPEGYLWIDYKSLNIMVQFNNCLNIQLRNLLSLLEV
ncbi:NDP-hexose 2,3-dehydratase family protein [Clostridioides sp. ES-W-0016-02]|nr:NDP-hexose 2,3-dehydratase family protein [Clostridioides sp. ES-W-0016-02]